MSEIFVAGETLVDLLPDGNGEISEINGFSPQPGGAPANVAVGLSKLGHSPELWTRLGTDEFSRYLESELTHWNIDTSHLHKIDGETTTLAVVSPKQGQEPRFNFYGSNDVTFGFESKNIPQTTITDCDWMHFGGVALTHPEGAIAMLEAVELAQREGITVSFDPNLRPALIEGSDEERVAESVARAIELSDVIFCSPEDVLIEEISGIDNELLAEELLNLGPHTAIVTIGEAGVVAKSTADAPWGRYDTHHSGHEVEVVDTTGAGDAFTAASISRFVEGDTNIESILEFASATAGLTVSSAGGMSAFPTPDSVYTFLQSDKNP